MRKMRVKYNSIDETFIYLREAASQKVGVIRNPSAQPTPYDIACTSIWYECDTYANEYGTGAPVPYFAARKCSECAFGVGTQLLRTDFGLVNETV